jgi:hypothetical protein
MYTFRIRFKLPSIQRFTSEEEKYFFRIPGVPQEFQLFAREGEFGQAEELVITGKGFPSRGKADDMAKRVHQALRISPIITQVGVSFGQDPFSTQSFIAENSIIAKDQGHQLLDDSSGISIFEEGVKMTSIRALDCMAIRLIPIAALAESLERSVIRGNKFSDKEELVLDLFSTAQFEQSRRAKFLLLVSIIEILAEGKKRSVEAQGLIDELVEKVKRSKLDEKEGKLLGDSIGNLKEQSIGQRCRTLLIDLGLSDSTEFWNKCYSARSKITHTGKTSFDIRFNLSELDQLVCKVLRSKLGV